MTTTTQATIEADERLPIIRITRDFAATPAQLFAAHTDPELFAQWVGPHGMETEITVWDARNGGEWRFVSRRDGQEYAFRGCFHQVDEHRIVQTFTYEGDPDGVALKTLTFRGPRRRPHPAARPVAGRLLRGEGRVAALGHGGRGQRGVRQARAGAGR